MLPQRAGEVLRVITDPLKVPRVVIVGSAEQGEAMARALQAQCGKAAPILPDSAGKYQCFFAWRAGLRYVLTQLMYAETHMTKPLSLAMYLAVTTLALQSGCQSAQKGSVAGPMIDAASADARIYVSGAD